LNQLYESFGVELGELRPRDRPATKTDMAGHIVIAPPGALNDRWSRRPARSGDRDGLGVDAHRASAPASATSSCR